MEDGREGGQVACLLWLALLLFPSSLPCALRTHGAVETVPGMARTVVVDAVHMSSPHDYDTE